jgi:hypothetical protein
VKPASFETMPLDGFTPSRALPPPPDNASWRRCRARSRRGAHAYGCFARARRPHATPEKLARLFRPASCSPFDLHCVLDAATSRARTRPIGCRHITPSTSSTQELAAAVGCEDVLEKQPPKPDRSCRRREPARRRAHTRRAREPGCKGMRSEERAINSPRGRGGFFASCFGTVQGQRGSVAKDEDAQTEVQDAHSIAERWGARKKVLRCALRHALRRSATQGCCCHHLLAMRLPPRSSSERALSLPTLASSLGLGNTRLALRVKKGTANNAQRRRARTRKSTHTRAICL